MLPAPLRAAGAAVVAQLGSRQSQIPGTASGLPGGCCPALVSHARIVITLSLRLAMHAAARKATGAAARAVLTFVAVRRSRDGQTQKQSADHKPRIQVRYEKGTVLMGTAPPRCDRDMADTDRGLRIGTCRIRPKCVGKSSYERVGANKHG